MIDLVRLALLSALVLPIAGCGGGKERKVPACESSWGLDLVWVPGGSYKVRAWEPDPITFELVWSDTELTTTVDGLCVMRAPLTQDQYGELMGAYPSFSSDCGGDCPVEHVSYWQATRAADWLNAEEGRTSVNTTFPGKLAVDGYRLLTQAEWIHAALGGESYAFPGSDDPHEVGWYQENSGGTPHPVCQKPQNGYGLCDMAGNVNEWVFDGALSPPRSSQVNPIVFPRTAALWEGGSYLMPPGENIQDLVDAGKLDNRYDTTGFRLGRHAE